MISSSIQNELIDAIKGLTGFDAYTVEKYDGQLSVEDISEVTLNLPAVLVFYNGSEFSSQVENNAKYNRDTLVQLLVCSDNLASKDAKNDEALDIKDALIDGLTNTEITFTIGEVPDQINYHYAITIVNDNVAIRHPLLTVISVRVMLTGLDN